MGAWGSHIFLLALFFSRCRASNFRKTKQLASNFWASNQKMQATFRASKKQNKATLVQFWIYCRKLLTSLDHPGGSCACFGPHWVCLHSTAQSGFGGFFPSGGPDIIGWKPGWKPIFIMVYWGGVCTHWHSMSNVREKSARVPSYRF